MPTTAPTNELELRAIKLAANLNTPKDLAALNHVMSALEGLDIPDHPAVVIAAIKGAIFKWKLLSMGIFIGGYSGSTCPLCRLFPTCSGCPVMTATGNAQCSDTPYRASVTRLINNELPSTAMMDFLISLLPPEAPCEPLPAPELLLTQPTTTD
jgi:hypothetical protein